MNYFLLLLCIIIPVILPIILCFKIKGHSPKSIAGWKNTFKISPNEWLLSQSLFWCSLLIPFLLFISFGLVSWCEYNLDMSRKGLDTFIEISKLPLWLLAMAAPFSVIIARAHGTEQTATQIKELIKKNNNDSYFNQKNDFLTYFKGSEIDINSYSYFFQSSIEKGSCQADRNKILEAKHTIEFSLRVISIIEDAFNSKDENYDLNDMYFIATHALIKLNRTFNIHTYRKSLKHSNNRYYRTKNTEIKENQNPTISIPQIPLKSVILSLIELIEAYNKICDYCQSNERFDEDNQLLKHAIALTSENSSNLIIRMDLKIREKNWSKNISPSLKPINEHCLDNFKKSQTIK
jgi:hypothetical protein